jgi:esterase/lipase superfamily enzyme
LRYGLWVAVLLLLAGCASRPGLDVLNDVALPAVPGAKVVTVHVATTRASFPGGTTFSGRRAQKLSFAEYTISVPPNHVAGQVEWPDGNPDPARTFVTLRQRPLTKAQFEAGIAPSEKRRQASAFVHGFNVTFQEALFQAAQMSADADTRGTPILFSWPSAGQVLNYVGDKDAVTISRDGFAETIASITKGRRPGEALLLGHSMGGWLTLETLRQLKLSGRQDVLDRLEVILADPDVDIDVFRSQVAVIGPMKPPLRVLVAKDDVALKVSAFVAGDRGRVGAIDVHDPRVEEASHRYGVQVIDISSVQSSDGLNHSRFSQLAAHMGGADNRKAVQKTGAFVLNSVGTILAAPFHVAGEAIGAE